jgi:hypothetical protein
MRSMLRGTLGVLVAVVAVGAFASAALAQSTTMYPKGDSVSLNSMPITVPIPSAPLKKIVGGNTTCTLNGGAFTVPTTGNSSGPEAVSFTTEPTFTGCTSIGTAKTPVTITTSGTWTMSVQYGIPTAVVTIPSNGLTISLNGTPYLYVKPEHGPISRSGGWDNGFSSPLSVSSALDYLGPVTLYVWEEGENTKEVKFPETLQTMTDTTHPASLPVVGP